MIRSVTGKGSMHLYTFPNTRKAVQQNLTTQIKEKYFYLMFCFPIIELVKIQEEVKFSIVMRFKTNFQNQMFEIFLFIYK